MEDQSQHIARLETRLASLEARAAQQDRVARRARWFRIAVYVALGLFYVSYIKWLGAHS